MPSQLDCAAVLLPKIEIKNISSSMQKSWLSLVNESSFETIKHGLDGTAGGTVGLPVEGIPAEFTSYFSASWTEFQQRRADYLSHNGGSQNDQASIATFRQSLTDAQLAAWTECIHQHAVGISVLLKDDSATNAVMTVHYGYGNPGIEVPINVTITNGTVDGSATFTTGLFPESDFTKIIDRSGPTATIIVAVNSDVNSDSAQSIWPLPVKKGITFGAINASQLTTGSDAINVQADLDGNFVRALDPASPTRFYVPSPHAPGGLPPTAELFMVFSSAVDTDINVTVVEDNATAREVTPTTICHLTGVGPIADWGNRQTASLGSFPVRAETNYIVISTDAGHQLPLINAFWFTATTSFSQD